VAEVPYVPQEIVRWVPETVELPQISSVQVHAFSGDLWDGVKVCRKITRGPFAMPRGHVSTDLVAIVLRAPEREDGQFGSAHVTHRGGRGSVNVLPAGMPYTYSCEGERETLHLSITGMREPADDDEPGPGPPALGLRPLFAAADPVIVSIGTALLSEATADSRDRLYGESMATALRAHLVRRYGVAGSGATELSSWMTGRQIQRVLDFIEGHLSQNLALGEMAKVAGMSRTRFLRSFKRTTGVSPHQYLMGRRVERAKLLLADPDLSLHEVASRLGYAEQASFSRAFRHITQTTPGAYRTLYHR
jgi:AraC-like DNA-binding protein